MPAQRAVEGQAMSLRSLLFVPGDRPERFAKAAASGADAIIIDLEDSVATSKKADARKATLDYLRGERPVVVIVRVNPLDSGMTQADLDAVLPGKPDMIMHPKAEGAGDIRTIVGLMGDNVVPVLPIATETPAALFQIGSFGEVADRLAGLTWGAEDLPAAIGASTARNDDGSYTAPYEVARALTLFGAHAAGVAAIETVYPAISDLEGLATYAARGRRDGFTGMMAIHPSQVPAINAAFTPTDAEIARARAIVQAFAENPEVGAIQLDGKMIDAPHLKQAKRILEQAG